MRSAFGIEVPVALLELDVAALASPRGGLVLHRDVTSFPPLRQDIAVIVHEDVPAGDVVYAARSAPAASI